MTTTVLPASSASTAVRKIYVLGDVLDYSKLVLFDTVVRGENVQILAGPHDSDQVEQLARQIERSESLETVEITQEAHARFDPIATLRALTRTCVEIARPKPSDNLPYYRRFERRPRAR